MQCNAMQPGLVSVLEKKGGGAMCCVYKKRLGKEERVLGWTRGFCQRTLENGFKGAMAAAS